MQRVYVCFAIRIRLCESLSDVLQRVERVLGCKFTISQDHECPDRTVAVAEALCLSLTLSQGVEQTELFHLHGENVIEPRWDYSEELNISRWMLEEFCKRDSSKWYIPSLDELKAEAGIR